MAPPSSHRDIRSIIFYSLDVPVVRVNFLDLRLESFPIPPSRPHPSLDRSPTLVTAAASPTITLTVDLHDESGHVTHDDIVWSALENPPLTADEVVRRFLSSTSSRGQQPILTSTDLAQRLRAKAHHSRILPILRVPVSRRPDLPALFVASVYEGDDLAAVVGGQAARAGLGGEEVHRAVRMVSRLAQMTGVLPVELPAHGNRWHRDWPLMVRAGTDTVAAVAAAAGARGAATATDVQQAIREAQYARLVPLFAFEVEVPPRCRQVDDCIEERKAVREEKEKGKERNRLGAEAEGPTEGGSDPKSDPTTTEKKKKTDGEGEHDTSPETEGHHHFSEDRSGWRRAWVEVFEGDELRALSDSISTLYRLRGTQRDRLRREIFLRAAEAGLVPVTWLPVEMEERGLTPKRRYAGVFVGDGEEEVANRVADLRVARWPGEVTYEDVGEHEDEGGATTRSDEARGGIGGQEPGGYLGSHSQRSKRKEGGWSRSLALRGTSSELYARRVVREHGFRLGLRPLAEVPWLDQRVRCWFGENCAEVADRAVTAYDTRVANEQRVLAARGAGEKVSAREFLGLPPTDDHAPRVEMLTRMLLERAHRHDETQGVLLVQNIQVPGGEDVQVRVKHGDVLSRVAEELGRRRADISPGWLPTLVEHLRKMGQNKGYVPVLQVAVTVRGKPVMVRLYQGDNVAEVVEEWAMVHQVSPEDKVVLYNTIQKQMKKEQAEITTTG